MRFKYNCDDNRERFAIIVPFAVYLPHWNLRCSICNFSRSNRITANMLHLCLSYLRFWSGTVLLKCLFFRDQSNDHKIKALYILVSNLVLGPVLFALRPHMSNIVHMDPKPPLKKMSGRVLASPSVHISKSNFPKLNPPPPPPPPPPSTMVFYTHFILSYIIFFKTHQKSFSWFNFSSKYYNSMVKITGK